MERSIAQSYIVPRKSFGKQPLFNVVGPVMLDSINPNVAYQKEYVVRNPVHCSTQVVLPKSEHEANTTIVEKKNQGINHVEGGWPKEVHHDNEEETTRYRRRIERDDAYVHSVLSLVPKFEKLISQNNAIDIYQQYFHGMEELLSAEKATAKLNNTYRDPDSRPVAGLAWTIENDPKLVVSYCDKKYPVHGAVNKKFTCYQWDLENPESPAIEFDPPAACWDLACSPSNPSIVLGGLEDGRVCVFDLSAHDHCVSVSPPHTAHRAPVTGLLYVQSRDHSEFFTSSSDGLCMWHDLRNLSRPIDMLIMSVNVPQGDSISLANAEGITSIHYDRNLPTRFFAGTESGLVINVNRRGKTQEDKMSSLYQAHFGPVRAVHRSPCTSKMFLSCGDWTTHIWSEDIKVSPIISGVMHRYQILDAVWAPDRYSGYMTVSADGYFRYWDLLRKYREPVLSMPLANNPILKISPLADSQFVAFGGKCGRVFLVSLSNVLCYTDSRDKQLMLQTFERENHREAILTARIKEIRLKFKTEDVSAQVPEEDYDEESLVRAAEEEYRRQVIEQMRSLQVQGSRFEMRKR
ncbi:hypothetical protein SFRURICE_004110 [Spodoptera frugiperda]|uniref:Dynein axonemal intermediate chain 2-like n=1 Tax=Spodoptera frugiperda TaxID=7108 RepID=A0A2H1W7Y2_SPOFR|nr:dynein axonemal intermediate chain 2-like [Spodoptera frugiperda]KAF9824653.1 hypothetical protein SFRURICE_004110 [Spodoptera frugiperda]